MGTATVETLVALEAFDAAKLKEAVTSLNKSGVLAKSIKTVGLKKDAMLKEFLAGIESIPVGDDKEKLIPPNSAIFYNACSRFLDGDTDVFVIEAPATPATTEGTGDAITQQPPEQKKEKTPKAPKAPKESKPKGPNPRARVTTFDGLVERIKSTGEKTVEGVIDLKLLEGIKKDDLFKVARAEVEKRGLKCYASPSQITVTIKHRRSKGWVIDETDGLLKLVGLNAAA
jgi:hypothetical protein